ncbi:uncharacterized protein LOC142635327 [Castanea sativa]|uniref:uncharacterized protein LOC142635327 n=1 Tax=Castanea sativa TaxID=21020 RepID=UPI003F6531F9
MVSSLIDVDTKWWKFDLVRSTFLPFEADSILRIPISYSLLEDQLIWIGNKRGSFTVKSAYYIAMRMVEVNDTATTTANIVDLAAQFIGKGMLRELDLFFMVLWSIWGNRNQALHNDAAIPPSQVWESANRAFTNFSTAQLSSLPSSPSSQDHWTALPSGFFKINVDGASDDGGGNSCIGVIIRDSSGSSIGALSMVLPSCYPAEITEAFALLQGVLFALEMQVNQAIFESDALSIILALSSGAAGSDFGHILEDIRAASRSLSHCSFHHLIRDGNKAVHSLAKEAILSGQSKIWKGTSPPCIWNILRDDIM